MSDKYIFFQFIQSARAIYLTILSAEYYRVKIKISSFENLPVYNVLRLPALLHPLLGRLGSFKGREEGEREDYCTNWYSFKKRFDLYPIMFCSDDGEIQGALLIALMERKNICWTDHHCSRISVLYSFCVIHCDRIFQGHNGPFLAGSLQLTLFQNSLLYNCWPYPIRVAERASYCS